MAFCARYAPGLTPSELDRMTPEETRWVRRDVERMLKDEGAERVAHTKAVMRAAGMRVSL